MDPALWELLRSDIPDDEEIEAIIRLDRPDVDVSGVRIMSCFGPIATCRLRKGAILTARGHENVVSLKHPGLLGPEPAIDPSPDGRRRPGPELPPHPVQGDERRPPGLPWTGAGVVVGVVDWGCDIDHPSLQNPDGTTRLRALWDQRDVAGGPPPEPYGYGTVHPEQQINQALGSDDPYAALGYHPADADRGGGSHGMHVADIAAGNGRGGGPVGLAPEAELVFVHLADRGTGGLATLGDSVRILEAIDFVFRLAGDQPCVVNLSVGKHGGPHDGCTLTEMALDHALDAALNRVICQSAGNYFGKSIHASGRLTPGTSRSLTWVIDPDDRTPNELEIWYGGEDELLVEVESPSGRGTGWVPVDGRCDVVEDGVTVGRMYHRACDPNNEDNHVDLFLDPSAPPGKWQVTLRATAAVRDGTFHAWLERDQACPPCQAHFAPDDADDHSTIGTIANGQLPLVVGAYDAHAAGRDVAPFSSAGPTRTGEPKPDVVAPGVQVLAARSAPSGSDRNPGLLTRKSGTSMAAPHVTGAVALCLQAAPRPLTAREVRALVLGSTIPPSVGTPDRPRLGHGYVDVERLLAAATDLDERPSSRPARRAPRAHRPLPPPDPKGIEMDPDTDTPHTCCMDPHDADADAEVDIDTDIDSDVEAGGDDEAIGPFPGPFPPGGTPSPGPPRPKPPAERVVVVPGLLGSVLADGSLSEAEARQLCEKNLGTLGKLLLRNTALYPCDRHPETLWGALGMLHWLFASKGWQQRITTGNGLTDPGNAKVGKLVDLEVNLGPWRVEFKPYTRFVQGLKDEGLDVLELPYDWRLSVRQNMAVLLKAVVTRWGDLELDLQGGRPQPLPNQQRVTLIGHSLGGLVARAFTESIRWTWPFVKRLITIGTPHLGAPQAYLYWIGRMFPFGENPFSRSVQQVLQEQMAEAGVAAITAAPEMTTQLLPRDVQRSVVRFMASTVELLPAYDFVTAGGRAEPYAETYRGEKHAGTGRPVVDIHGELRRQLVPEQDLSRWLVQRDIDYHFVAATGFSTTSGYVRDEKRILVTKDGDGTVPLRSAAPLPAASPRVARKVLGEGRLSHARLCERPDTLAYCLEVLGRSPVRAATALGRDLLPDDLVEATGKILREREKKDQHLRGRNMGIVLSVAALRRRPTDPDTTPLVDPTTKGRNGGRELVKPPAHLFDRQVYAVTTSRYGSLEYVWISSNPDARVSFGGVLFLPLDDEDVVHLVTFNVGQLNRKFKGSCTNAHHAEIQLERWLLAQPGRWRERIGRLDVVNRSRRPARKGYSPCSYCCGDLANLPGSLRHPSKPQSLTATFTWGEPYAKGAPGCDHATAKESLALMKKGGWTLSRDEP